MGRRLALTVEAFYRDLLYLSDYYDQTTFGGAVSVRKPISEFIYAEVGIRPQQIEIDAENNASDTLKEEEGDFFYNPLEVNFVYDDRDDLFLPRKGRRVSAGVDVGLGGDTSAVTLAATGTQHILLPGDTILNIHGRYENVSDADHIFVRSFDIREFLFLSVRS